MSPPALLLAVVCAPAAQDRPRLTPEQVVAMTDHLTPSLVKVEWTLQYDKGEAPHGSGWTHRCPHCGEYHSDDLSDMVDEERPMEAPGWLLSDRQVLTTDPQIHPRFVKETAVRFGRQRVPARPAGYSLDQNAIFLQLDKPLEGARALEFKSAAGPLYLAFTYEPLNGTWATSVYPLAPTVSTLENGHRFVPVPPRCLILDQGGALVGASLADELPLGDAWKGSPRQWPMLSADEMARRLAAVERIADGGLLRVTLNFRSPKKRAADYRSRYRSDEETATEQHVLGVLVDARRILVLACLKAEGTGRLTQIRVHGPDGAPVAATFQHTLKDFGALVATLERPLNGPVTLSSADILRFRNRLLLAAEIRIQGEKRVGYYGHGRIPAFLIYVKGRPYPDSGGLENRFLFGPNDEIVALPLIRRRKVSEGTRHDSDEPDLTPALYLREVLADLPHQIDDSNVPLSEEEESRLAWMGVELQPMTRELARAKGVSALTQDGETGAVVTYVYPGSPAAQAGVQPGHVLLRLHVKDYPKPVEIELEDDHSGMEGFPWDRLDDVPDELMDRIPMPWPSADNTFTRALTEIGFGKSYQAEFFVDGKTVRKAFQVVQSPTHYDAAARWKAPGLGLTVRDLTYEVRRFFQQEPDDPGVIVSKVEPGGKAAVAGIRPYEIITHVNDAPVRNVQEFGKLVAGQEELRLAVLRMTRSRLVKIKVAPATQKTTRSPPEARQSED